MATLQGAIDELITVIDAVAGVDWAPDDPPANLTSGPVAVVHAGFGQYRDEVAGMHKGLHDPQIILTMQAGTMPQQVQVLLPLLEPVIAAMYSHRNGRTSSHYDTFVGIDYTFGPVEYNGIASIAFIFTIRGLKIQNTL